MYLLGYDIGSSSVKAALVDSSTGLCVSSASYPDIEAPIISLQPGWAEQRPDDWWSYLCHATSRLSVQGLDWKDSVSAIGISYQMHGLVCVDKVGRPLRNSIIWCDSRAVPYGQRAFRDLGADRCLTHLLNSPGNFTASKLAWVKENEPDLFNRIDKVMLPGDYIAMRLTGEATTTVEGLTEGMMWDFCEGAPAEFLLDYYGVPSSMLSPLVPTFGEQGFLSRKAADELGLKAGVPVTYRAGDQQNNALSLNVFEPGEVAATAGTSGVVYGVLDRMAHDPLSRVNTFAHVNYSAERIRLGVLLCINGTGILNSWLHHNMCPDLSYSEMNQLAATVPVGSDGLLLLPFGNGTERMLQDRNVGASFHGLDLVRHQRGHVIRAAHEGIACAFAYGMKLMEQLGIHFSSIHAGTANMFLSPVLVSTLADLTGSNILLYDTDGAAGAARGAGMGAKIYANRQEAFSSLHCTSEYSPNSSTINNSQDLYARWEECLSGLLQN